MLVQVQLTNNICIYIDTLNSCLVNVMEIYLFDKSIDGGNY